MLASVGELKGYVRDDWCIPCDGKGFFKCPNCLKGVVAYKEMSQIGVSPFNNAPIMGTVTKHKPCEGCDAKGAFDCPHCENGKHSGNALVDC